MSMTFFLHFHYFFRREGRIRPSAAKINSGGVIEPRHTQVCLRFSSLPSLDFLSPLRPAGFWGRRNVDPARLALHGGLAPAKRQTTPGGIYLSPKTVSVPLSERKLPLKTFCHALLKIQLNLRKYSLWVGDTTLSSCYAEWERRCRHVSLK